MKKNRLLIVMIVILSIIANIYLILKPSDIFSYLQSDKQIYIMEAGILKRNEVFYDGNDLKLEYDFNNEEYIVLKNKYNLDVIAQNGSEFNKALKLMNAFSKRLTHLSNYDNHIDMNAVDLLEYSLDNKKHGINCRSKAQILNEMCLSLNIYSRKVWIIPNSIYDDDCHVVNEIWDSSLNKWIMLDITNNEYWVDENKIPLSILEIREKGMNQEFCTPVNSNDKLSNLNKLKEKHLDHFLYIMKNMVYMKYCKLNTVGETSIYVLLPDNFAINSQELISKESIIKAPEI